MTEERVSKRGQRAVCPFTNSWDYKASDLV